MTPPIPRYRVGFVAPLPVQDAIAYTFYQLVPTSVMLASVSSGLEAFAVDAVDRALERFWTCVDLLTMRPVDIIVLGGVPLAAYKGRGFCGRLLRQIQARTGV